MTQCCYKTHKKDPENFPKIDAVSTSQLLRGNTKGTFNQYCNTLCIHGKHMICIKMECVLLELQMGS